jgi:hypothetical protein
MLTIYIIDRIHIAAKYWVQAMVGQQKKMQERWEEFLSNWEMRYSNSEI